MHGGCKQEKQLKQNHILWLAAFMTAIPAIAAAQTQDLGEINITSSRAASPSATSSKPVTVINRKMIDDSHAENVVDLLKGQANIVVSDTSGVGAKAQVDLGGFGETAASNSLVLVDGRRVNSPDLSGTDWTQIPIDQIERIEIVHGASSVLYGNGAVGGVINIITRIPESGGAISLGGGSFGEFNGKGRIGADSGTTRLEANISGLTTNGYRDNNFFERFDGGARAEADLPANISLHISGNHHRDRAGLPGSLTTAKLANNRKQTKSPLNFSKTTDNFIDGGLDWDSGYGLNIAFDGGFRRRETSANYSGFLISSTIRTRSLRPKLTYLANFSGMYLQALTGADMERNDGVLSKIGIKRKQDGYYGRLEVGGDDHRWNISGGGRTERIRDQFTKNTLQTNSKRKAAWEAGTSVELLDGLRLRLNTSRSLRFPLLDEEFSFSTSTVNLSLLPQTGQHYSAGIRYAIKDAWAEVNFSRADITSEIFLNPVTFSNSNYTDKTRHNVVMVSGHWHANDLLNLSANYTYTRAYFRGGSFDGNSIPAVSRNRFGANWTADWLQGLSTNLHVSYVGSSILISDQANKRPRLAGYLVMDAVVNYDWQDVEMFARVDNLTSRNYSSYGVFSSFTGTDNFYPAPTATFRAGVSYKF
jgi:outer membrane cobalamin receptor